jgi:hypothetical protein
MMMSTTIDMKRRTPASVSRIKRTTISIDSDLHAFGKQLAEPLRGNFSLAIEMLLRKAKEQQEAAA